MQIKEDSQSGSIDTLEMLNVYDKDEDLFKTIKEINDDILVYDGSTYFEKTTNKRFSTISLKRKVTEIWKEFWAVKLTNN